MIQAPTARKPLLQGRTKPKAKRDLPEVRQTTGRSSHHLKAFLDFALTIPTLIFIAPLLILVAVAVKLDSPGPVLYRRRVLGKDGRVFDAFKFRTMYVNGDEILARHPRLRAGLVRNYKLKCDPRVTRVGQILRKFSLDELPQLFNVLLQDMSLVGPRAIAPEELAMYGEHGEHLLTVLPGLTGLWQVSGCSDTCYNTRVQLDMDYINNWSIWLDIAILCRTIPAVLKGEDTY